MAVPHVDDGQIAVYVEALLGPVVEERLRVRLPEAPDDWLATLPAELTLRSVRTSTLVEAAGHDDPAFVKPPNDKSFEAKVYKFGAELPAEFDPSSPVLVSEPVAFTVEFRCFCLDGRVRTLSPYFRDGRLSRDDGYRATAEEIASARRTAEAAIEASGSRLPAAIVIDVGLIAGRGWAVIEANGAWGSGIYGCDPAEVFDVVSRATIDRRAEA